MDEFQRLAKVDPRFAGLVFPEFIRICATTEVRPAMLMNERLHQGEREALALAIEVGAEAILMDERAGRGVARALGFQSIGVLGILVQAKTLGLVPAILPLLGHLESHARFWIAPSLMRQILGSVGE